MKGREQVFRKDKKSVKFDQPPKKYVDEETKEEEEEDDDHHEDNESQEDGGGGNGGGNNNEQVRPMACPYLMGQVFFQGMHPSPMGSMQNAPVNHMENFTAGAMPPGYLQAGMMASEMFAPPADPYQHQYMPANPPLAYDYAPRPIRYSDPYTTMFSDENPNACSIM